MRGRIFVGETCLGISDSQSFPQKSIVRASTRLLQSGDRAFSLVLVLLEKDCYG